MGDQQTPRFWSITFWLRSSVVSRRNHLSTCLSFFLLLNKVVLPRKFRFYLVFCVVVVLFEFCLCWNVKIGIIHVKNKMHVARLTSHVASDVIAGYVMVVHVTSHI